MNRRVLTTWLRRLDARRWTLLGMGLVLCLGATPFAGLRTAARMPASSPRPVEEEDLHRQEASSEAPREDTRRSRRRLTAAHRVSGPTPASQHLTQVRRIETRGIDKPHELHNGTGGPLLC